MALFNFAKVSSATLWSLLDVFLGQGLRFVITIVLARILSPDDFGTVALLAIFIGLAGVFVESGLGLALIQKQEITEEDTSTVFWFNVGVAFVAASALVAVAPCIAVFFGKPVLVPLTTVMAINVVISSFGGVHRTLLVKRLEFRSLLMVGAISTVVSGATAIAFAMAGYGLWALAAQTLLAGVSSTLLLWLLSSWRPHFSFSFTSLRGLFGFGGYMLASSLLDVAYSKSYTLLIGKYHGTADLGQFSRAEGSAALPTSLLTSTIARVAFPALSSMSHDRERVKHAMRFGLQSSMLVNAPAMLGLAAVADPFIAVLYGPQWQPAVHLLQILCLGGVLMPMHVLNLQALMALGRSDLFFRLEVIKKVIGVALLVALAQFGPIGIAWGVVLASLISLLINTSQTSHLVDYGTWQQLRDAIPAIVLATLMAGCVFWLIDMAPTLPPSGRLAVGAGLGMIVYVITAWVIDMPGLSTITRALMQKYRIQPNG